MKPIKPKYEEAIKVEWKISKRAKEIVVQYAKYTKYDESEVVDMVLAQIIDDENFIQWLNCRRYQKRIKEVIFGEIEQVTKQVGEVIVQIPEEFLTVNPS